LFRTKFKPWPNIYAVNPADIGPNGKPRYQPAPEQPAPAPEQPAPAPEQPAPQG
jgi:hypothetical protein